MSSRQLNSDSSLSFRYNGVAESYDINSISYHFFSKFSSESFLFKEDGDDRAFWASLNFKTNFIHFMAEKDSIFMKLVDEFRGLGENFKDFDT